MHLLALRKQECDVLGTSQKIDVLATGSILKTSEQREELLEERRSSVLRACGCGRRTARGLKVSVGEDQREVWSAGERES